MNKIFKFIIFSKLIQIYSSLECLQSQPDNTFCDDTNLCKTCNNSLCLTCSSDLSKCLTCKNNDYLFQDNCYTQKPKGAYCDDNTKKCEKCVEENCEICNENKNTCTQCDQQSANKFNYQNKCFESKPQNTSCDSNNKCTAISCPQNCQNCDINNPNICIKCDDNYYLLNYENNLTKCEQSQPKDFFCKGFVCNKCSDECQSCENNKDNCKSCDDLKKYLFNQKCYLDQPLNSFCSDDVFVCQACENKSCKRCQSNLNDCINCLDNLYQLQNDCLPSQPLGTFCDEKTKVCQKCKIENCTKCNDDVNKCSQCDQSMPQKFLYKGQCTEIKPQNVSCDSNNLCVDLPCSVQNCLKCDQNIKTCTECQNGYFLLNGATLSCVQQSQIPENYFCNDKRECNQCSDECASCEEAKDNCKACKDSTYYLYKAKNNYCRKDQPDNAYCDPKTKICVNCQVKMCQKCSKASDVCDKCQQNFEKYLFKNDCQSEKPKNTVCDQDNVCEELLNPCNKNGECPDCFSFNSKCSKVKPKNAYCDKNLICESCQEKDCLECGSNLKCTFKGCQKSEYSFFGSCSSMMPENAYCNSNTNECQQCTNLACSSCESDLSTCIECLEDSYFYKNKCHDKKPKNVFCKKQGKLKVCQPCHELCSECSGSSELECENCYPDSVLSKGKCIKSALKFNSSISLEQVAQIQSQAASTSQASTSSSTALSLSSNLVSRSSFGLVVSGLTSQKLTYMVLVNTNLPAVAFSVLKSFKDQLPQNQMKFLNVFVKLIDLSDDEINKFINIRFESVQLSYNILKNCGQGISLFIICYFFFLLSYLLIEKSSFKKLSNLSSTLYSKLMCGMIVQYFQICLSIFVVGINTQILEFIKGENYEMSGVKITLIILLIVLVVYIIYLLYKYLNNGQMQKGVQNFYEITREKILNETIFESKIRRNFILIYLLIESIIIPTIFIQFFFNPILTSSLAIFSQLAFLIIVCILMPFHSKLTNAYFIVSSALWLALYIIYLLLNIYSSKPDIDSYASVLDHLSWAFFITIQIILLSNPAYMVLNLLNKLAEFISQKLSERKRKQQQAENQSLQLQEINFNSVQYFPQGSQTILIDDDISSREIDPQNKVSNRYKWINKLK
ncbi:hypothetical protein ABPG72_013827 [Tetrahymena utriculariae]